MPPKDKDAAGALQLSAKETENLALAWQCFTSEPQIDYAKFAALAGYTKGSAQVTIGNIKRKLKNHATGVISSAPNTPAKTPGKGGRKKRTTDNDIDETPTKKNKNGQAIWDPDTAKTKKGRGKKNTDNDDNDIEDDEEDDVKVKKEEEADVPNDFDEFLRKQGTRAASISDDFEGEMEEDELV